MQKAIDGIVDQKNQNLFILGKDTGCSITDWIADIIDGKVVQFLNIGGMKINPNVIKVVLSNIPLTQYAKQSPLVKKLQISSLKDQGKKIYEKEDDAEKYKEIGKLGVKYQAILQDENIAKTLIDSVIDASPHKTFEQEIKELVGVETIDFDQL